MPVHRAPSPSQQPTGGAAGTGPMSGRTVLVTGGSGGIGKATATALAAMGARVAIVSHDRARAERARDEIRTVTDAPVDAFVADLSSQAEVRRLADDVLGSFPRIDVLVNNVGGYWSTRHESTDGLEYTFALNHLAPFLLTNLLLRRLRATGPSRVVIVASNAQALGRLDFDDLQGERAYSGSRAYNQSKLANVMFAYELARRLEGSAVTANALHPGMVSTSFGTADPGRLSRLLVPLMRPFMKSTGRGAATSVRVASAPDLATVTGRYFAGGSPRRSSRRSYDLLSAARLWRVSAALVGLEPGTPGSASAASSAASEA
ncbi:SDR family oxidoreductase [Luteimicrobium sp. DT211]|uniref:SDR family oxidoreductase n=1 Tax=Luteimicrobium sp. DT211 TaxID=3393412 RepID=UPI003CEABE3B